MTKTPWSWSPKVLYTTVAPHFECWSITRCSTRLFRVFESSRRRNRGSSIYQAKFVLVCWKPWLTSRLTTIIVEAPCTKSSKIGMLKAMVDESTHHRNRGSSYVPIWRTTRWDACTYTVREIVRNNMRVSRLSWWFTEYRNWQKLHKSRCGAQKFPRSLNNR